MDASIGIAVAPEHGQDADTLLRCADVAMYQAKRSGTGVAMYCRGPRTSTARTAWRCSASCGSAIERDELLLHYQPKLDLRDGTLVGVEALVRWQHPQRGFLPPSEFIPLAEQTGLIYPLSRWVLEAALRQHQAWRARGHGHPGGGQPVAAHAARSAAARDGRPAARRAGTCAPGALVLEITESSLMADPLRAGENLSQLRALGVRMSIDDFGTGYSSLASLKNLSVDELKIDQSFVQAMATDASARAIVRAIIDLADALKLRVVAEGVEDRATWDVLAGLGCDVAQGYFLSRPIAAAELEAWVADGRSVVAGRSPSDPASEDAAAGAHPRARRAADGRRRVHRPQAGRGGPARQRGAQSPGAAGSRHGHLGLGRRPRRAHLVGRDRSALRTGAGDLRRHVRGLPAARPSGRLASRSRSRCRRRRPSAATRSPRIERSGRTAACTGSKPRAARLLRRRRHAGAHDRHVHGHHRAQAGRGGAAGERGALPQAVQGLSAADVLLAAGRRRLCAAGLQRRRRSHRPKATSATGSAGAPRSATRTSRRSWPICTRAWPSSARSGASCATAIRTHRAERDLALSYVFVPPQTVMVHTEDITEAKQAEQQREAMAQSEKLRALGQMATGIAHDLNQSLMLVASYSDLARQALVQDPPNLAELEDLLTTTTQAALDGGETVKRLLLFTRAAPEQDSQPVDLSSVVRDAAQLTAPRWRDAAQAEGRPISLHIEADGHPTIQGSPAQLRELMTNLIFNAVDALPTGGTIRLRVVAEDGQGIVEVADSGVGMSAEVQARVFEPFFTTKGEGGTGLGLAMVFGIVEQHGGHIEVRSAPGDGTTFRITFPLVDAVAATLSRRQRPPLSWNRRVRCASWWSTTSR